MAAIAPITGMLRKRFFFDLSFALSVGVTSAYGYWCVHSGFLAIQQATYTAPAGTSTTSTLVSTAHQNIQAPPTFHPHAF